MDAAYSTQQLRLLMVRTLKEQGFVVDRGQDVATPKLDKDSIRALHTTAVEYKRTRSKTTLLKHESRLLNRLAKGQEVTLNAISPKLVEVQGGTEDELLFRYTALHWSIPVSSGYGRRLRFLVIDEHNRKLIGILGLGDPVFNLGARDQWIGWNREATKRRLRHVMDIFALGAVPPYSYLLCGKLVALLATSDEVQRTFEEKYSGKSTLISVTRQDGKLALLTTTSALGRSSIYNRLKIHDRLAYIGVGTTKGYGEFQFSNGVYSAVSKYAIEHLTPSAKHAAWGKGFRNRREVIRKFLSEVGLSDQLLNHSIHREIFVIPLAKNSGEFLRGETGELERFSRPAAEIIEYFRHRWLLPRSQRDDRYLNWSPEKWRLWDFERAPYA